MAENYKVGGGGHQQPYDKTNGEYVDDCNESFDEYSKRIFKEIDSNEFCAKYNCTAQYLEELLGETAINYICNYTNPIVAANLNYNLRHNTISEYDRNMFLEIKNAIGKFELNNDVHVSRGIHVPYSYFVDVFQKAYNDQSALPSSALVSTSRDFYRALQGAVTDKPDEIGIVFSCDLVKGDRALPIESISKNPYEKEIMLSNVTYFIQSIKTIKYKEKDIKLIDIIIVR